MNSCSSNKSVSLESALTLLLFIQKMWVPLYDELLSEGIAVSIKHTDVSVTSSHVEQWCKHGVFILWHLEPIRTGGYYITTNKLNVESYLSTNQSNQLLSSVSISSAFPILKIGNNLTLFHLGFFSYIYTVFILFHLNLFYFYSYLPILSLFWSVLINTQTSY